MTLLREAQREGLSKEALHNLSVVMPAKPAPAGCKPGAGIQEYSLKDAGFQLSLE
jgi:hypothetical protein